MNSQSAELDRSQPSVAVVMATFNRAHLISESIDSILNQTHPPDEFIVVNDGSTDDTAKVVRRYGRRVKYVEKANGGKSSALNIALPSVESTYTWIFDDDDVALPGALEAHLKFLSENPQCDFTYSTNYVFSGVFSGSALGRYKLKTFPARSERDYFLWIMGSPFLPSLLQGMLIPTRCYREVGEFDDHLHRGQDCDMILRIARRFRAGFTGQPTFAERVHEGRRGPSFASHAEADRYRIWQEYKRQIFGKLRASLSLEEYLPKSAIRLSESQALGPAETRLALLQRAVVMATHALYLEAVDDLRDYVGKFSDVGPGLSDNERRQISKLAYVQNRDTVPPSGYYRAFGDLIRGRRELFRAAMRGLYWSIAREIRQRHLVFASHLIRLGANLAFAYAGMPANRRKQRHPREFM
jgi:glycosyltransferase involved in cell wall biosynthesis